MEISSFQGPEKLFFCKDLKIFSCKKFFFKKRCMICRRNANFCIADGHSWFLLFMASFKYYPKISLVSVRRFAFANSCRQLVLNCERLTLTSRSIAIKALWIPSLKLSGIGGKLEVYHYNCQNICQAKNTEKQRSKINKMVYIFEVII